MSNITRRVGCRCRYDGWKQLPRRGTPDFGRRKGRDDSVGAKGVLPHRQNKRTRSSRHGMNLRDRPINRDELLQAEDSAAFEAHGCSDPGMEAAAMERAVLMASELHHPTKEKNTQSESTAQPNDSGASRSKINNLWVDSLFHQGHQGHRNAAEIDGDKTRTSDEEAERERLMNEIYFQMKSSQRVNFLGL